VSFFAIGDIHGHLDRLNGLLAKLPFGDRDTLVFLGDYVDRGPDSKGVIDRLIALQEELGKRCICLLGNHDDMFLDYRRETRGKWRIPDMLTLQLLGVPRYGDAMFLSVGGDATLNSYSGDVPEEHIHFLAGLPLRYDTDRFAFVHAGLRPTGLTSRGEMLWGADGFWGTIDPGSGEQIPADLSSLGKTVVVGHAAFDEPQIRPGIVAIDTGSGVGGPLTAVQLPDMIFYSEPDSGFTFNTQ
jgi:serine/threonine protein phosphatase 1